MDDEAAMTAHVALMDRHEELHPDLKPWLVPMKSGLMLKHPLVFNAFHGDQMNAWANERYRLKLAALDQARASGDWYTYIWLHERPHRVEALQDIAFNLRGREYWEMMSHVWSDSENIWQHRRAWRQVWLSKEPERDMVMDATEREHLASLPDGLTIYRGVSLRSATHGLSWTLDRERAQWFANRWLCLKRRRPIVLQTVAQGGRDGVLRGTQ
jgi:hypothetical protein